MEEVGWEGGGGEGLVCFIQTLFGLSVARGKFWIGATLDEHNGLRDGMIAFEIGNKTESSKLK